MLPPKRGATRNGQLKRRGDIFWGYYRNKKLNELVREEPKKKENPLLPRRFQIKQRECEADEEYEMRK